MLMIETLACELEYTSLTPGTRSDRIFQRLADLRLDFGRARRRDRRW